MPEAIDQLSRLITRRPFRRSAIDQLTLQDIVKKISRYGVRFSVPFGGYKSRWLPHSPHINWAEVLWLDYLRQYAEPMKAWVGQDIDFAFTYVSGVLGFVNGATAHEQEVYLSDLDRLMQMMSGDGIKFRLVDLAVQCGGAPQVLSKVIANYELLRASEHVLSKSKIDAGFRNCNEQFEAADAALRCEAMEMLPARRAFNKFGEHIQLTNIDGPSLSIHIGSCRSSIVQPWVGMGLFEQRRERYIPRILGRTGFKRQLVSEGELDLSELGLSAWAMSVVGAFPQLRRIPTIRHCSI